MNNIQVHLAKQLDKCNDLIQLGCPWLKIAVRMEITGCACFASSHLLLTGLVISAPPPRTTAVSSMKQQSGYRTSAGISITRGTSSASRKTNVKVRRFTCQSLLKRNKKEGVQAFKAQPALIAEKVFNLSESEAR